MAASELGLRLPLLRPDDIALQRFLIDKRGFDVEEVQTYLKMVAEGVRLLQDQLEVERARADDLGRVAEQAQESAYTRLTHEFGEAIRAADESASRVLADAGRQARVTVAGAQERAEAIIVQAKRKAQEILAQVREASATGGLADVPPHAGDANGPPEATEGVGPTAENTRRSPTGGNVEAAQAASPNASPGTRPDPTTLATILASIWGRPDSPRPARETNGEERGRGDSKGNATGGGSANGATADNGADGTNGPTGGDPARSTPSDVVELTPPSDSIDLGDLELNLSGSISDLFEDHGQQR